MKLSTHNQLAMLYRNFYGVKYLPNNLCNYFWMLVIALICTPFVWPVLVINRFLYPFIWYEYNLNNGYYSRRGYSNIPTGLGIVFNFLIAMFGVLLSSFYFPKEAFKLISWYELYTNGIILISILGIIAFIVVYIYKVIPHTEKTNEYWTAKYQALTAKQKLKRIKYEQSFRYLLIQRLKSWKDNNCPIIEWNTDK